MKKFAIIFFAALFTSPSVTSAETTAAGTTVSRRIDSVLASIEGEPITEVDFRGYLSAMGAQTPETPEKKAAVLREVILRKVIEKEAQASNITVSEAELDAYMLEVSKQNGLDVDSFIAALEKRGLKPETYKQQVKGEILRTRVVSQKVQSKVNVVDEEIDRYFKNHRDLLPQVGSVHIYQISLPYRSDAEREQALLKLAELREVLIGGASWSDVGGSFFQDLGFVVRDELIGELKDALEKTKTGEVSPVIELANSVSIISEVDSYKSKGKYPQSLREQVRKELLDIAVKARLEKYLHEELPKKYHVEIKL